mmetsp:Transcript_4884/g.19960  ORF Transcript_4884/g.19960 Transcript_4884/m.19960 type:complete len:294 (+) Transcript_4884:213-1094(+)
MPFSSLSPMRGVVAQAAHRADPRRAEHRGRGGGVGRDVEPRRRGRHATRAPRSEQARLDARAARAAVGPSREPPRGCRRRGRPDVRRAAGERQGRRRRGVRAGHGGELLVGGSRPGSGATRLRDGPSRRRRCAAEQGHGRGRGLEQETTRREIARGGAAVGAGAARAVRGGAATEPRRFGKVDGLVGRISHRRLRHRRVQDLRLQVHLRRLLRLWNEGGRRRRRRPDTSEGGRVMCLFFFGEVSACLTLRRRRRRRPSLSRAVGARRQSCVASPRAAVVVTHPLRGRRGRRSP